MGNALINYIRTLSLTALWFRLSSLTGCRSKVCEWAGTGNLRDILASMSGCNSSQTVLIS